MTATARILGTLMKLTGELTRRTPGTPDRYGAPTYLEATTTTPCWLSMGATAETADGTVGATGATVFLPAGLAPVGEGDAVVIDGQRWELLGPARAMGNARLGTVSHLQAPVEVRA